MNPFEILGEVHGNTHNESCNRWHCKCSKNKLILGTIQVGAVQSEKKKTDLA